MSSRVFRWSKTGNRSHRDTPDTECTSVGARRAGAGDRAETPLVPSETARSNPAADRRRGATTHETGATGYVVCAIDPASSEVGVTRSPELIIATPGIWEQSKRTDARSQRTPKRSKSRTELVT